MSSLNFIAILGRQPELGLVELESLLGAEAVAPLGKSAAVVAEAIGIDRLGGTQKLARVVYDGPPIDVADWPESWWPPLQPGVKMPFAVSVYGDGAGARLAQTLGLTLKKRLRGSGSVRWVAPAEGAAVTAAQLKFNQVLLKGFELVVVRLGGRLVVGVTVGVQDIDWYSRRDYDRPVRSARVGMLPPKLAQILVNTTAAVAVDDPFCGTGVVLAESLLLGRTAVGSDNAADMVTAAQANLEWLAGAAGRPLPAWTVAEGDARSVKLAPDSAVVSEGYLGPNLVRQPDSAQVEKLRAESVELYRAVLRNFAGQQPSGAEVAITAPAWRSGGRWHYLNLVDELPALGYTLKSFQHARTPRHGEHSPLLYAREDQIVGRQLLLLRKI